MSGLAQPRRLRPWQRWPNGAHAVVAAVALALLGCTVQLAPAYDETIENQADSLKTDFLRFIGERQLTAGTAKGYYVDHQGAYADFLARLAAMELRAEDQPGGVSCAQARELSPKATNSISRFDIGRATQSAVAFETAGGVSCATAMIRTVQSAIERFQKADEERCAKGRPPASCTTLFGSLPLSRVAASVREAPATASTVTDNEVSTFAKAVLTALDSLEGLEQNLKPAQNGH